MTDNVERCPDDSDSQQTPPRFSGVQRIVAFSLGVVCVFLAVLGLVLPLLPCTPFLLLASYLLVRSSPSLHRRLRASRITGRILTDWEEHKGIRPRDKVRAIVVIVASLVLTWLFGNPSPWFRFPLLFFVTIGLYVVVRLPLAPERK